MNNLSKNINTLELSELELDTVAGGFANNTNTSDVFKAKNLPFPQPSFLMNNNFQSNYNVTTHNTGCEIIYPITAK